MTLLALAVWVQATIAARTLTPDAPDTVSPSARRLAALSIFLWLAAITAGRLLAYTHTRMLVDLKAGF